MFNEIYIIFLKYKSIQHSYPRKAVFWTDERERPRAEEQLLEEERQRQEELEQKLFDEEMDRLALEALQAEEERLQKYFKKYQIVFITSFCYQYQFSFVRSIEETQRHNEEERIRFMTSSTNDCSCRSFGHQALKLLAIRACLMQNVALLANNFCQNILNVNNFVFRHLNCKATI